MTTKSRSWTVEEDRILKSLYLTHSRQEIADLLGRTHGSVRKRCWVLGLNSKHPAVQEEVKKIINDWYADRDGLQRSELSIDELAAKVGMDKSNVSRLARKMGLTSSHRPLGPAERRKIGDKAKQRLAAGDHPRGMAGKKHSEKAKQQMSKNSYAASQPLEDRQARGRKAAQTRVEKYGTGNPSMLGRNAYSRAKRGRRSDLGGQFFRSAWEANYARYLNFLVRNGEIVTWEYEPKTFVFHGVERGALTYTPDFKVIEHDGSYKWHEVKGWMDAKSKAKLKRMAKFYPEEEIVIIGAEEYRSLSQWSRLIEGWE